MKSRMQNGWAILAVLHVFPRPKCRSQKFQGDLLCLSRIINFWDGIGEKGISA